MSQSWQCDFRFRVLCIGNHLLYVLRLYHMAFAIEFSLVRLTLLLIKNTVAVGLSYFLELSVFVFYVVQWLLKALVVAVEHYFVLVELDYWPQKLMLVAQVLIHNTYKLSAATLFFISFNKVVLLVAFLGGDWPRYKPFDLGLNIFVRFLLLSFLSGCFNKFEFYLLG